MSDEVKLYSSGTLVSSARVMTDKSLGSGDSMHVSSGGTAGNTFVDNSGQLIVSCGGAADGVTVESGGGLEVFSGGTAAEITAAAGAALELTVAPDTFIQGTSAGSAFEMKDAFIAGYTVNSGGRLTVSEGGMASDTVIDADGSMHVSDGGTAVDTVVNCWMLVFEGGSADGTTVNPDGQLWISSGGMAGDTVVGSGGSLHVDSGGTADGTTVGSAGRMRVLDGGIATGITVSTGGVIRVYRSGTADSVAVGHGGQMYVAEGGTAQNIVENGGYVEAGDGAVVTFLANTFSGLALSGSAATVHSGTTANATVIGSGGILQVFDGGTASDTTVESDGRLLISSGGTAVGITAFSGAALELTVAPDTFIQGTSAGAAFEIKDAAISGYTIGIGGYLHVAGGGTALEIIENGGYVDVADGADVTFAANSFEGLTLSGHAATVHSGTTANMTVVGSDGRLLISSGGTADDTIVDSGGHLFISDGGTAVGITAASGAALDLTVAPDTFIQGTSGGSAFEIKDAFISGYTVDNNGRLAISGGGTAIDTIVNANGSMHVYEGGTADDTVVNCWLFVFDGGTANRAVVNSGGIVYISGGAAEGTVVENGGRLYVHGGANSTTVNSGGSLFIYSGGTASIAFNPWQGGTVISEGGAVVTYLDRDADVYFGGGADGLVSKSSAFSNLSIDSGCSALVYSRGIVGSTAVNSGGNLSVFEGGTVSGSLLIADGATVSAYSGAKIDFTVADQADPTTALINDWSLIRGGNDADYTITVASDQAEGVYLLAEGAAGFDRTVTVKTAAGTELGVLSVGGTLETETAEYTLAGNEGALALTITAVVVPVLATVAGNFGGVGGAFQLFNDGTAVIRTASGRTALEGKIDSDLWEVVGAGDFDKSGADGLLWLEKSTGYVYMQNDMTTFDEVNDRTNCLGVAVEGYSLKAAGDFSGNGIDGALLQGPAFGDASISLNYGLPVWARNDDGSTFNGWLGALVNTWQPGDELKGDLSDPADINAKNYKYDVIGVGDFNGDGVDDVMLQNTMPTTVDGKTITGSGDVFTFLTGDKAAIEAGAPPTVCYAGCATGGWEVVGFGDFDGDGIDDALLSDGTGVAGWSMFNGQRQGDLWFGNLTAGDEIAGIADVDGDGTEDILIRRTATEAMTAWLVQAGAVSGTLAIA